MASGGSGPPGSAEGRAWGGRAGFAPWHLFSAEKHFYTFCWFGGWVVFVFFLSFLHFYNLNYKPPEQMSNLLVIE